MKTARDCLIHVGNLLRRLPSLVVMGLITFYRTAISPLTPSSCRFHPTCSEYGLEAVRRFGFFKGLYLTTRRILRCRPGGSYGYDPVPEKPSEKRAVGDEG